jgi:hypothetical protein
MKDRVKLEIVEGGIVIRSENFTEDGEDDQE